MSSSLRAGRVSERRTKPVLRRKPVVDSQYRALFERSPQPLMVYERRSLRIVAVSDSAVECYGYSREELLAMTIVDLLPPEDREALVRFVAVDLGSDEPGRVTDKPWRVQRKNGQIIDVEVTSDDLEF